MNIFTSKGGSSGVFGPLWLTPGLVQNGAGPYDFGVSQGLFEYDGSTASVRVNLPAPYPPQSIATSGYIVAITNRGSGSGSVVPYYNGVPIDAAIPIGVTRAYVFIGDLLDYVPCWTSEGAGGGGSAIPLSQALATNANLSPAWTDGSAIIVTNDGVARTLTLPLIAAANVGAVMVVGTRTPAGSPGAITVAASGGQYISSGALTTNRSAVFVACDFGGASYGWLRTI